MLEKPKRAKQLNNQDRQLPATIQELINRYDLENKDIYKFLDYLVDNINENKSEVIDNLESESKKDAVNNTINIFKLLISFCMINYSMAKLLKN